MTLTEYESAARQDEQRSLMALEMYHNSDKTNEHYKAAAEAYERSANGWRKLAETERVLIELNARRNHYAEPSKN